MHSLRDLLRDLQEGRLSLDQAEQLLKIDHLEKLKDLAALDLPRHLRTGIPEVVFAETKSSAMILEITQRMLAHNHFALLTRLTPPQMDLLTQEFGKDPTVNLTSNPLGRTAFICEKNYTIPPRMGLVGIITAGSSDIPVASEVQSVLTTMGINTFTAYDIGIAGIHRLFTPLQEMLQKNVDVIIVVAGMEGTLPGVVASLVDVPVIAVPTSTGYGLGEKGVGALTTMLQSCAPGLAVVNIDNGFGAAALAALILHRIDNRVTKKI